MRLHRLRVTAFQAFAGTEQVDFDALGAAGLFLLHGDTGAGKTTLLDAVCFALYGEVPGARAREARLRSDHAAPDVRTEVELEVTLRDRRFRIVRRPKQERPKVRGEGVTEEGHGCTVQELRDGEWVAVAARPDEARAELAGPLGMSVEQFCQVVLLPQGEFASFLRAGSDDRWRLLERLFGTERFAQVEWWLRDRARAARAELHEQLRDVRDVVSRLSQAAEEPAPEGWEDEPELARTWAGGLGMTAQAGAVTAQEAATGARAARAAAEAALAAGLELSERRDRHAKATAELTQWEASRSVRDEAAATLATARAAAPLAPLLAAADARAAEAETARADADVAWERLDDEAREAAQRSGERAGGDVAAAVPEVETDVPSVPTLFDLSPVDEVVPEPGRGPGDPAPLVAPLRAHAAALRTRAGAFGALVAVEQRLVADEAALTELDEQATAADARVAAAAQAIADGEQERRRLDEAVQSARRAADRVEAFSQEAATATARASRAAERDSLTAARAGLHDAVRAAVDAEQAAHAAWLDLRERRLAGMAAELAADLRPGDPCAVCGATDHPAPATASPTAGLHPSEEGGSAVSGAPLAEQERAAQAVHAERAQERASAERAAAENATSRAAAAAVAGEEPAEALQAASALLRQRLAHARREADGLAAAETALQTLGAATATHEARRRDAEQAAASSRATRAERSAALDADRARVAQARGEAASLAARVAGLASAADAADAAAAAHEEADRAEAAHRDAAAAAAQAAEQAGFADLDDARAAVRDATAVADLERRLRDFDDGIARRTALVQDDQLRAAAAAPAPDLAALRDAAGRAASQDEESQGRHSVEQRRLTAVGGLAAMLDETLAALGPIAERSRRASELAGLADGSSTSNRLRMRLSAYVLAARLEEVAAAATARLDRMSNGRYALVHSDDGGRGRRRGGLELRIVDGWTGQERAPSTLSGGETFIASLALALGLADVVAAEAGGSRLETLFIDEGFGSLDERTLDEVLDVLDTLREGGRAVGIVSHVAELRQRVPAKLHVVKGRDGSRIEQSTATAAP